MRNCPAGKDGSSEDTEGSPAEGELPFEDEFDPPAEEVLAAHGVVPLFVRAVRSWGIPGAVQR